jgi:hypothetical protein
LSNYTKATNFASKDSLSTGNPAKVIKGTEIDAEYTAIASAISSKADSNSPTFTGTPLTTTASAGTSNTQIASTAFVAAAISAAVPSGCIIIWSGSVASVPSGWYLCNGSNGTPDLRDRFVIGAGSTYSVAATGGSANATVVSHTHTGTTGSNGAHQHFTSSDITGATSFVTASTYTAKQGSVAGFAYSDYALTATSTAPTLGLTSNVADHNHTFTTDSSGSSGTNANLPPYYALAYIMKA